MTPTVFGWCHFIYDLYARLYKHFLDDLLRLSQIKNEFTKPIFYE